MGRRTRKAVFTQFDLKRLMGEMADDNTMKQQLSVPVTLPDIETALRQCATEIANLVESNAGDLETLVEYFERDEDGDLQAPHPCDDSNVNDLAIFASAYVELYDRLGDMQREAARDRAAGH